MEDGRDVFEQTWLKAAFRRRRTKIHSSAAFSLMERKKKVVCALSHPI